MREANQSRSAPWMSAVEIEVHQFQKGAQKTELLELLSDWGYETDVTITPAHARELNAILAENVLIFAKANDDWVCKKRLYVFLEFDDQTLVRALRATGQEACL